MVIYEPYRPTSETFGFNKIKANKSTQQSHQFGEIGSLERYAIANSAWSVYFYFKLNCEHIKNGSSEVSAVYQQIW